MISNCLIIANDIGYSAPGVVYETILSELSNLYNISIVSPKIKENSIPCNVKVLPCVRVGINKYRITLYSFMFLGFNFLDNIWVRSQLAMIHNDEIRDIDVIISFVSNEHYKSLLLGYELSKRYNKKWIVYSVDAIPAPIRWTNNKLYYKRTLAFFNKYIKESDAFFSSNYQMLQYQLSNIENYRGVPGIIYTPIRLNNKPILKEDNTPLHILYTGNIYGPRKISTVLDGFRMLLKDYPFAKMVFVGAKRIDGKIKNHIDLVENGNVEFHKYTSDLDKFYKTATVLLDINAYFDNDVFLSSKIINYLPYNIPIVSITGLGSPGRNIFTGDASIIHCSHEPRDIYEAFHKAVSIKDINIIERTQYIEMFEAKNCVRDFVSVVSNIVSNN